MLPVVPPEPELDVLDVAAPVVPPVLEADSDIPPEPEAVGEVVVAAAADEELVDRELVVPAAAVAVELAASEVDEEDPLLPADVPPHPRQRRRPTLATSTDSKVLFKPAAFNGELMVAILASGG